MKPLDEDEIIDKILKIAFDCRIKDTPLTHAELNTLINIYTTTKEPLYNIVRSRLQDSTEFFQRQGNDYVSLNTEWYNNLKEFNGSYLKYKNRQRAIQPFTQNQQIILVIVAAIVGALIGAVLTIALQHCIP